MLSYAGDLGVPLAGASNLLIERVQGHHAGVTELLGRSLIKPPSDQIGGGGRLYGQWFQLFEQFELPLAQAAAPLCPVGGLPTAWVGFPVHLGDLRLAPAVQAALRNKFFQARQVRVEFDANGDPNEAPGHHVVAPGHGAHGVHGFMVRRFGYVPVSDAQVAFGAFYDAQALCNRAQIRKVVQAQFLV